MCHHRESRSHHGHQPSFAGVAVVVSSSCPAVFVPSQHASLLPQQHAICLLPWGTTFFSATSESTTTAQVTDRMGPKPTLLPFRPMPVACFVLRHPRALSIGTRNAGSCETQSAESGR